MGEVKKRNVNRNNNSEVSRRSNKKCEGSKTKGVSKRNIKDHVSKKKDNKSNKDKKKKIIFSEYINLDEAIRRYMEFDLIGGTISCRKGNLSGNHNSFVTCDRASLTEDVIIESYKERNRAIDGDYVYVELVG